MYIEKNGLNETINVELDVNSTSWSKSFSFLKLRTNSAVSPVMVDLGIVVKGSIAVSSGNDPGHFLLTKIKSSIYKNSVSSTVNYGNIKVTGITASNYNNWTLCYYTTANSTIGLSYPKDISLLPEDDSLIAATFGNSESWTKANSYTPENPRSIIASTTISVRYSSSGNLKTTVSNTWDLSGTCEFTINFIIPVTKKTITFNPGDGRLRDTSTKKYYAQYGSTIKPADINSGIKDPTSPSYDYYVNFYNDKSGQSDVRSTSVNYTQNWKWDGWYNKSSGGTKYNNISPVTTDLTVYAQYSKTTNTLPASVTFTNFPSPPTAIGYIFKGWSKDTGEIVGYSVTLTTSNTKSNPLKLTSKWEAKKYIVSYDLNGGTLPKNTDRSILNRQEKTYGNTILLLNGSGSIKPERLGYTFKGWACPAMNVYDSSKVIGSLITSGQGKTINDTIYNAYANSIGEQTSITLAAQWEYKPNSMRYIHYYKNGDNLYDETFTYNIGEDLYRKGSPDEDHQMGADYEFIGWTASKPNNWDNSSKVRNGYHGVYSRIEDILPDLNKDGKQGDYILPIIVYPKQVTEWGTSITWYGLWIVTGKYIRIGEDSAIGGDGSGWWVKSNSAYVYVDAENGWKVVKQMFLLTTDTPNNISDTSKWSWKKEAGQ